MFLEKMISSFSFHFTTFPFNICLLLWGIKDISTAWMFLVYFFSRLAIILIIFLYNFSWNGPDSRIRGIREMLYVCSLALCLPRSWMHFSIKSSSFLFPLSFIYMFFQVKRIWSTPGPFEIMGSHSLMSIIFLARKLAPIMSRGRLAVKLSHW